LSERVPFENEALAGCRSPRGTLLSEGTVPDTLYITAYLTRAIALQHRPMADCSTEVSSHVGEAEEGCKDGTDASVQGTGG
jgi:hypothetical protein